ncbi:abortive infection protein [Polaribacter pacificus]|uniref:Abortive infection protein n=1 Tax=Polaribacter pacificus TaxID=1775173 RepID=A0A917I169_9FLAO|nr:CPBP family intramembrane glutamic endopeptidase [Polaribacter pacificus]GGH00587.1 abortive infection protein [Polaribacter pacificus]
MNFIQKGFTGNTSAWFYVLTLVLVFLGIQFAGIPLILAAFITVDGDLEKFQEGALTNFMEIGMDSNLYLFLMIFTFMVAILVLFLCVRYLHKRKFISILTARKRLDWKRVFFAFALWGGVSVVTISIGIFLSPEDYVWNFKLVPFAFLVLISFVFLPFQTSAEEFIFRGYLMQGLGVLAKNKWFPLLVTSAVFGLLHGMNPEVEKLGYITMVFYIGTGLLYGITTLMDEGTELALGLHASNNIVAAFFVTTDWTVFRTEALFVDTSEPQVTWDMFASVLVFYPLLLLVFSKKYGWKNWKDKLFGKVVKPISIEN